MIGQRMGYGKKLGSYWVGQSMYRELGFALAFLGVVYVTSWPACAVAYISFGYYRLCCMRVPRPAYL